MDGLRSAIGKAVLSPDRGARTVLGKLCRDQEVSGFHPTLVRPIFRRAFSLASTQDSTLRFRTEKKELTNVG